MKLLDALAKSIVDLLKVKSLVTIVIMVIFGILAIQGKLEPKDVLIIISNVITYYFAKGSNSNGV